jgi:dCMP deaminase
MTRPTRDQWAMNIAKITATRTSCCRRAVGCVLTNSRGHLLSTGYNGVAAGMPHCNEVVVNSTGGETTPWACPGAHSPSGTNLDGCHALHAEQNALLQCRDVYQIETAYVTTAPCMTCTKLLLNTSCKEIMYVDDYPQAAESKKLWESASRVWRHYSGQ